MGYIVDEHIKIFCSNKTIEKIEGNDFLRKATIKFTDGSSLCLMPNIVNHIKSCGCSEKAAVCIAVPYDIDGKVKQSTEIMKENQKRK